MIQKINEPHETERKKLNRNVCKNKEVKPERVTLIKDGESVQERSRGA